MPILFDSTESLSIDIVKDKLRPFLYNKYPISVSGVTESLCVSQEEEDDSYGFEGKVSIKSLSREDAMSIICLFKIEKKWNDIKFERGNRHAVIITNDKKYAIDIDRKLYTSIYHAHIYTRTLNEASEFLKPIPVPFKCNGYKDIIVVC